jgi:hypothetical protein
LDFFINKKHCVVPKKSDEVLFRGAKDEIRRITGAFLKMKKFAIDALENARLGNE